MKNALRILVVVALAAAFALPALAQDAAAQENEARAQQYQKFIDLYKGTPEQQKQATEIAREYIAKYGSLTDESDVKILNFLRDYVTKFERADRDFKCNNAITQGNFNEAVALCRPLLAEQPDNVRLHLVIGRTGYLAVSKGNKAAAPEALNFLRRTAQLIEAGKPNTDWTPFAGKDDTLGWLSYMEGLLVFDTQPDAAAKALLKAAQTTASTASKEPSTYDTLAILYTKEYRKAAAEYQQKFPDGTEITPERRPEYDRLQWQLDKIKDRIIDTQARFVALSTKPEQQAEKNKVMTVLTAIYKDRHNGSDAGLKELIAGILAKPVMVPGQEPTPAPVAPAPTTTTTGTPATGTNPQASQTGQPAAATTQPAATQPKPAANTAAPQPKPAASTPRP